MAAAQTDPARDPQGFVREVVNVELQAAAHAEPRWMYRLEKTNASGTKLTQIVETQQGLVGHLLEINGKPLDAQTQRNEKHRLMELRNDPQQWRQKLARQERDRRRVLKIVSALPTAFLYTYEGTESGAYGAEVRLSFKPNPRYSPDSMETDVLKSMSGTLQIAQQQQRLVSLKGTLDGDVNIGLGIAGKLTKGGTLDLEQSEIAAGSWEITKLKLAVTGRALIRHLDMAVDETATDFKPVSSNLNVAQAIDLLLKSDPY